MDNSVRTAPAIVLLVMGLFYHMGESALSAQTIRVVAKPSEPFRAARNDSEWLEVILNPKEWI
jgi:hypothetical protein